jgi:hypothetical protein
MVTFIERKQEDKNEEEWIRTKGRSPRINNNVKLSYSSSVRSKAKQPNLLDTLKIHH